MIHKLRSLCKMKFIQELVEHNEHYDGVAHAVGMVAKKYPKIWNAWIFRKNRPVYIYSPYEVLHTDKVDIKEWLDNGCGWNIR